MKKLIIVISFAMLTGSYSVFAVTLEQSFQSALATNVTDKINDSRINQSVEFKKQQQSAFLPYLNLRGTYLKQENVREEQRTVGLGLTQNLYNGGRDRANVNNAETFIHMSQNQREIDRRNLHLRVIDSFYTLFLNINDMKNIDLLYKQSKERAEEIRKRAQIGRARKGELLQAEAQLATAEALAFAGKGLIKESSEAFSILTGLSSNESPDIEIEKYRPETVDVKSAEEYVNKALAREDVENRKLDVERIDREMNVSKHYYLPTLNLAANYLIEREGGNFSSSRDSDWDIGLYLVFPLYEGGFAKSRAREDVERKTEAVLELNDYERAVKLEVSRRYETFRRYYDQIKAFDMAMERGKKSYEEAVKDYRLGLVSNLDVLSSLNIYLENKRNAERTRIQALMTKKMLDAVVGEI